ncbi:murein biosynthesis integral membrane protein MurJ [Ferrimicrobium acidiphilum]|uniref:murein biosynthesis integral membrane protein MurJ n=1 Tax=Ferrimicrobium acidiphilum TaxID=121039 RepID=UPI0023F20425|nr:murein biosynthesis integral membrane protein MurJ [Ferrimicrobium acidiphilum]
MGSHRAPSPQEDERLVFAQLKRLLFGTRESASQNAALLAAGTLTSRLTGLVRLVALAVVLGVRPLADAYNLGNNTPNMLYDLLLGGIISSTLLPVLSARFSVAGRRLGAKSQATILTLGIAGLLIATVIFELLAPAIIGLYTIANHHGYAVAQRELATELLRLFAPQLFFYGAISLFTAVLNLRGNFASAAFAPIANNVVSVLSLVVFAAAYPGANLNVVLSHRDAALILGLGSTAGVAAQMLVLLPVMFRLGVEFRPSFSFRDPAVKEMFTLSSWTVGFVVANQVAVFVVQAIADPRPGYISAYNYAYLFFQLPYAIVSLSIMTALQPRLARLWAVNDRLGFATNLSRALRASVAITLPLAAIMLVGAPVGLDIVLRYGAVSLSGVRLTAVALEGFAVGLPGFALFLSIVQGLQATRNARVVFVLYLVENGLNILLAFLLVNRYGIVGLTVSLSAAYTVAALLGLVVLLRMHAIRGLSDMVRVWLRLGVIGAVLAVVLWKTLPSINAHRSFGFLLQTLGALLISAGIFVVLNVLAARLSRQGREIHR